MHPLAIIANKRNLNASIDCLPDFLACIYELSANESDGIKSTEYFGPLLIGVIVSLYALIKISTSGTSYIYNLTIIISIFSTHKTNITI